MIANETTLYNRPNDSETTIRHRMPSTMSKANTAQSTIKGPEMTNAKQFKREN